MLKGWVRVAVALWQTTKTGHRKPFDFRRHIFLQPCRSSCSVLTLMSLPALKMTRLQRYSDLVALSEAALEDKSFADLSQTGNHKAKNFSVAICHRTRQAQAFRYSMSELS